MTMKIKLRHLKPVLGYVSVAELAEMWGVTPQMVRSFISDGRVQARRIGSLVVIPIGAGLHYPVSTDPLTAEVRQRRYDMRDERMKRRLEKRNAEQS